MHELDIEQLIPHRDRMKLINAILELDTMVAVTSTIVSRTWPLCAQDAVDPVVLIEVVAQTAGVLVSWKKGSDRENMEGGILAGIKNAEFFVDRIPVHTELITTVKTLYSIEDYEGMEGSVLAGSSLLGRIQLQVFGIRSTPKHDT